MEHVRWLDEAETDLGVTNPVVLAAFTGWNDAGDAASSALRTLIESAQARPIAEIDPEWFTDFATVRPHVRLDDDQRRHIVWPTVGVWAASLPGADVLLILGPEPALRWQLFCEQLAVICERAGATLAITLGALLADVPHTRPTHIIGTAADDALIDRFDLERSNYEGPTGIVGVLQHTLSAIGLQTASLWAAVPGYAAQISSPKAAVALVERACAMIGTPVPRSELAVQADDYEAKVAGLIGDDDDLRTYVTRLEAMADEMDDDGDRAPSIGLDGTDPAALTAEIERFLRERGQSD
ncbi:MAG TPA: PAC2 family protein [Ilumatobacter sp.]|nr:PAC2 family protein [Ilumatobacter sp.]